jgi:hypothetical protein
VTAVNGTAYRNENSGDYEYIGPLIRRSHQREYGFYAQDSWRMFPGLTLTFGARWELLRPWVPLNNAFSWASPEDVWGPSGPNSIFKPGASGGQPTVVHDFLPGTPSYKPDNKTVAPSFGFAWTPKAGGWLGKALLGSNSQNVLRGGFSIAYFRQSISTFVGAFGSNPGGTISANRTQDLNKPSLLKLDANPEVTTRGKHNTAVDSIR